MEFRKVLALRGPNLWALSPVLEAWVDLQDLQDSPSNRIPGFYERLTAWLPTLIEHECSEGCRGGFLIRLREGTYLGHILEHVTLELMGLAGFPMGFGRARETAEPGVYKVVFKYRNEQVARACLETARELCLAAVYDRPFDIEAELRRLRDYADTVVPAPGTASLIEAARARGIPHLWLNGGSPAGDVLQLGHGARQRRLLAAQTDRTGAIADAIARDQELTRSMLQTVGIPVPTGTAVAGPDEAWDAVSDLGTPAIIKPREDVAGSRLIRSLTDREEVAAAYAAAREISRDVVVERLVPGAEYRLLVVDGQMVAAVRRDPPAVTGDGRSTVAQLVEEANRDPRRGVYRSSLLHEIAIDPAALDVLGQQGYSLDSIPPEGANVLIRRETDWKYGGTSTDATDQVHPKTAALAAEAAQIIGLAVAGIDVVAEDIARPLAEQGGAILEVRPEPALEMHLRPTEGTQRRVDEAILSGLFPEGQDGRIPIVAVTGVNGKTTTVYLVDHILRATGRVVGMTCTEGIYLQGRRIKAADCAGPRSARALLMNPQVEAAVLECARGGILREGLGFDRCNVAVVTNIGEGDHLGLGDIHTLEKLALVKRTVVEVVLPRGTAVLKADDPLVAGMAPKCKGSVTFFARDEDHPVIAEHRAGGGRAAFVRDGSIVLAEGAAERVLMPLSRVPLTHGGRTGFQVENVLAATAAAWALGVPDAVITAALREFVGDVQHVPGRYNVLSVENSTVVVDFGHNPSALTALVEALEEYPHHRRTVVFSADGDRKDDAILRQAEILGDAFDRFVLYEEEDRNRGRRDGEIIALIRKGLASGSRVSEIVEAEGELPAIETALATLGQDELLLILHDNVAASLAFIQRYLAENPAERQPAWAAVDNGSNGHGRAELEMVAGVSGETA